MEPLGNKTGLLGGSFNPAHEGHVYISIQAMELLGLDEIWWLVSPQNPLKEKQGMAPFEQRVNRAKEIAAPYKNIIVSDFESSLPSPYYTYDTLLAIKQAYPNNKFVWLMGADNILQFPKWHKWQEIMDLVPVAVFNRDNMKEPALTGEFASLFAKARTKNLFNLATSTPPAWGFMDIKTHPASSTSIRGDM